MKLQTGIPHILASNLGPNTGYLGCGFRGFSQSLYVNAGILSRLSYDRFLPNPLQILQSHP
jgi:hypothetical protein